MKLTYKIILGAIAAVTVASMSSCEKHYYEDELYRKEIYLVSGDDNIFGQEYTFEGDTGHLSIYCSSVTPIDRDVEVTIAKDHQALVNYNKRIYDQNFSEYALELPADRYKIDNMTITLKAGADKPYALCDIWVNTDGLDPDETYFIPLRIESVSDYMVSRTKDFVLYQVQLKNDYATTKSSTMYSMRGTQRPCIRNSFGSFVLIGDEVPMTATKTLVPIDWRTVRIMPGAREAAAGVELRNLALAVTVDPFQTLEYPELDYDDQPTGNYYTMQMASIRPYNDNSNAIGGDIVPADPCWYSPEFTTFHLSYYYHVSGEIVSERAEDPASVYNGQDLWYLVTEELYDTRY
jgi:hypothetical protein